MKWEMTVLLERLKRHWVVSCNGGSRDEKGGASGNKYGVPLIPPVVVDEEIVGGIGASTGLPEEDRNVAQAGIDHLLATLKKS